MPARNQSTDSEETRHLGPATQDPHVEDHTAPEPVVFLTRDAILAAEDQEFENVHVPLWGGWVRVRALTGKERDNYEESLVTGKGKNRAVSLSNARAKLVSLTVVDAKGARLFSQRDVERLGEKSAAALDSIFEVAQRLAGLSDEDLDELTGNSESDQNDDSTSD